MDTNDVQSVADQQNVRELARSLDCIEDAELQALASQGKHHRGMAQAW